MNLTNGLEKICKTAKTFDGVPNIMRKTSGLFTETQGFTLAEVLTALVIAAMVLVTVLGIYSRAESVSATITRRLEDSRLPCEVLQRIAEDFDRIITADAYTKISINNKFDRGYPTAQLTITKTIVDAKNQTKVFEEITWQTNYDYDSDSLVLYRRRTSEVGLLEDKLLDEERESWEQALFVPICDGITFFKAQAVKDGEPLDKWSGQIPLGIEVTISFAEPFKTLQNTWDVFDEQKFTRTIAVDRTRKIKFKIEPKQQKKPEDKLTEEAEEPGREEELGRAEEPGEAKEPGKTINPIRK